MRTWFGLSLLLPLLAVAASPDRVPGAHWAGVVVGVGTYEHLDPALSLAGPRNDVPLLLTWLERQGVPREHLTVLADQVSDADGPPTRAAIMTALAGLPEHLQAGDIALLYFAGHGSVEPQEGARRTKADGMEELFLPRDVGRWDGAAGHVANAIRGSDIGRAVEALRARGVFVWLIFDSCHSATMARALQLPGARARAVAPASLGVTAATVDAGRSTPPASRAIELSAPNLAGGYVAFYAAQTDGIAPELPLPAGEAGRKPHGLFTYALLKSLAATGAGSYSYRALAHRILAFYAATYPATTPEFEGSLDSPIGAPAAPLLPPGDWPAQGDGTRFHIDAGRFNGIAAGTLLALSPALSADARAMPLGVLRVTQVSLTDAWAEPVVDASELRRWKVEADRTGEAASGLVRPLESSWDLTVRIAGPAHCLGNFSSPAGCAAGADSGAVGRARNLVSEPGELPSGARLTSDPSAADLLLLVSGERLFIVRPGRSSTLEHAASIDLAAADARGSLQAALLRAARAVALDRLAAEFPGPDQSLTVDVRARDGAGAWHAAGAAPAAAVALNAPLAVQLQDVAPSDLDVTVLSIDERFAITPVFPLDGESNRLRHGSAPLKVSGWATSAGHYELLVITDESHPGSPHDLSYLAQPGVTRGAAATGFAQVLERAGLAAHVGRSLGEAAPQAAAIRVVQYDVLERQ